MDIYGIFKVDFHSKAWLLSLVVEIKFSFFFLDVRVVFELLNREILQKTSRSLVLECWTLLTGTSAHPSPPQTNVYLSGNCLTWALHCNHAFLQQWSTKRVVTKSHHAFWPISCVLHVSGGKNVLNIEIYSWIILHFRWGFPRLIHFPNFKGSSEEEEEEEKKKL